MSRAGGRTGLVLYIGAAPAHTAGQGCLAWILKFSDAGLCNPSTLPAVGQRLEKCPSTCDGLVS